MRIITLSNYRRDSSAGSGVDLINNNNNFTCYFNRPITIPPKSKVVLIHAELNNNYVVAQNESGITLESADGTLSADYTEKTTIAHELVYIDCPSLPVQTMSGFSNGGKGMENHIIGLARTGMDTDTILNTDIEVDLHNTEPLILTQIQIRLLDSSFNLKTFDAARRQNIVLGIKCGCDCNCK